MMMEWFDIVGIIGVMGAVGAFFLVVQGKMDGEGFWFPFINAMATVAVTISLLHIFNLAAFVTEVSFFVISCYGMMRYCTGRRKLKIQQKELIDSYKNTDICVYLASPYTHSSKEIMKRRYLTITHMSAHLSSLAIPHFCPITQSHVEQEVKPELETTWEYWQKVDTEMVKRMDELWICSMPGIEKSKGVIAEFKIAKKLMKPIKLLTYDKKIGYILKECTLWKDVTIGLETHGKINKAVVERETN